MFNIMQNICNNKREKNEIFNGKIRTSSSFKLQHESIEFANFIKSDSGKDVAKAANTEKYKKCEICMAL
jgi:hypothetical protein